MKIPCRYMFLLLNFIGVTDLSTALASSVMIYESADKLHMYASGVRLASSGLAPQCAVMDPNQNSSVA